jgi:hypothetical protein
MKTTFLLPNYWKWIGWPVYLASSYLIITAVFFDVEYYSKIFDTKVFTLYSKDWKDNITTFNFIENNILDELVTIANLLSGLVLISYKSKFEDEFIKQLRLETYQWATLVNIIFIVIVALLIYKETFINFMYAFIFSFIFFNVVRLHYLFYKFQKISENEE